MAGTVSCTDGRKGELQLVSTIADLLAFWDGVKREAFGQETDLTMNDIAGSSKLWRRWGFDQGTKGVQAAGRYRRGTRDCAVY